MSSLCLSGDGMVASLFASAMHLAWTPADGVPREESWHVHQGQFELFAVRERRGEEWVYAARAHPGALERASGRDQRLSLR